MGAGGPGAVWPFTHLQCHFLALLGCHRCIFSVVTHASTGFVTAPEHGISQRVSISNRPQPCVPTISWAQPAQCQAWLSLQGREGQ